MEEKTAERKLSCPACGGEAVWTPAKQALVCPYCGMTSPATLEAKPDGSTEIVEHDLVSALRSIPDTARGYSLERRQVRCQSCQAVSLFDASRASQACDFCGSTALVPFDEVKEAFRPESVLPMKVGEVKVREEIRRWYGSHFFAPNALAKKAMTDRVFGLYVPYWTFDANVDASWTAESGDYYYETETYRNSEGRTETRQVRRVRWYFSSGNLSHFFDDELVSATRGLDRALLGDVEPYPTTDLVAYDPSFLSGFTVERYQLDLVQAAQESRAQMESKIRSMCASRVPGDTHRNLEVQTNFRDQKFKHILVPIWVLSYQYRGSTYQVLVNGVSGKIAGKYPLSPWKVALAVIFALVVAFAVVAFLAAKNR